MERTIKADPKAVLWKKIGGGSFHATINGRTVIIKPNQEFYARPEEIPAAFKNLVAVVDMGKASAKNLAPDRPKPTEPQDVPEPGVPAPPTAAVKTEFFLKHRGGGWYDVLNADGKVQNETALKKAQAEELIANLKA